MEEVVKFPVPKISEKEASKRNLLRVMHAGLDGKPSEHWDAGCFVDPVKVAEFQKRAGMTGWKK